MLGNLSTSALAAAAAECADGDSVIAVLGELLAACGSKYAMAYRFDQGLQSAADEWTPLYVSFPAEITDYYRKSRYVMDDNLARAAFGSYAPVRLSDIVGGFEMSPARQGLHALFAQYGIKDMLGLHVCDRPGRLVYIALAYDRVLDDVSELEGRRLRALLEMFMRQAGALLDDEPERALSPKERDVIGFLAAGASNKEIARELGISISTVNTLVHRCYEKLGAHNRTEAAIAAARAGFSMVA